MVLRPSTIEEQGSPIISDDTIGSSVYAIIPFKFVSEASFRELLTSSLVTSFFSVSTISATEPLLTGTRSAIPSSLPSNSGITTPIDFAPPVVVGIIDTGAAQLFSDLYEASPRASGHSYMHDMLSYILFQFRIYH